MDEHRDTAKIHFTVARLEALRCPEGQDRLTVCDDTAPGLRLRVYPSGKKTLFWYGKAGGRPIRQTIGPFPGVSMEKARKEAYGFAKEPPKPLAPPAEAEQALSVGDAFDAALAATERGAMARKDWEVAVKRFQAWREKAYPLATLWKDLRRVHFRDYLQTRRGRSDTRIRLDMQPLRQTARFMANEHEIPDFAGGLRLGSKLQRPPRMVYVKDVLAVLDYLKEHAPNLEAGAALQGLAGLQLLEVLRLTWDKVNLKDGLIEVSGETKNEYRARVIPICGRVLEVLKRTYPADAKVQSLRSEYVVLTETGKPFLGGSWLNYGARLGKQLRAWNDKTEWQPKDLRNCLPTLAAMEGVLSGIWEQYIGHAAGSVTMRHYVPRLTAATEGEKDALEKQMGVFKTLVVAVIEAAITQAKEKKEAAIVEVKAATGTE